MFRQLWIVLVAIATVFMTGVLVVKAGSAQSEKSTGSVLAAQEQTRRERQLAATEAAKQLLLAMDTDKTGRISKEEWMRFMEAEFDRLDTDHKGQLDVKELTQSRIRVRPYVGK
jgi:hypothetical protein